MPLTKDGLTGWPTADDPDPGARRPPSTRMLTGFPQEKKKEVPKPRPEPSLNPELDRKLAEAQTHRADVQVKRVAKLVYQAYEVEPLTRVPAPKGGTRLFSRTCKLGKCNRHFFDDEQTYLEHVFQVHGSAAKDAKFRELTAEPEESGA